MSDNRQVSTLNRTALMSPHAVIVVSSSIAACGSDAKNEAVPVPKGFDLPAGVTLTPGGTILTEDKSASVIYQVGSCRSVRSP